MKRRFRPDSEKHDEAKRRGSGISLRDFLLASAFLVLGILFDALGAVTFIRDLWADVSDQPLAVSPRVNFSPDVMDQSLDPRYQGNMSFALLAADDELEHAFLTQWDELRSQTDACAHCILTKFIGSNGLPPAPESSVLFKLKSDIRCPQALQTYVFRDKCRPGLSPAALVSRRTIPTKFSYFGKTDLESRLVALLTWIRDSEPEPWEGALIELQEGRAAIMEMDNYCYVYYQPRSCPIGIDLILQHGENLKVQRDRDFAKPNGRVKGHLIISEQSAKAFAE